MDVNDVITKLDAQVVCGDLLAADESGVVQLVGKIVADDAQLNDVGQALYDAATPAPTPRRRRAPTDAAPTGLAATSQTEAEPAVEPTPDPEPVALNLNVASEVATGDNAG